MNFGLTPEQVKELTEAAARGATGPLTSGIIDLSKRLGVTEDATKTLLRIVGQQDVPLPRSTTVTSAVDKQPACVVTLGGRSGGLLTHSSYTTSGDTTLFDTSIALEVVQEIAVEEGCGP